MRNKPRAPCSSIRLYTIFNEIYKQQIIIRMGPCGSHQFSTTIKDGGYPPCIVGTIFRMDSDQRSLPQVVDVPDEPNVRMNIDASSAERIHIWITSSK